MAWIDFEQRFYGFVERTLVRHKSWWTVRGIKTVKSKEHRLFRETSQLAVRQELSPLLSCESKKGGISSAIASLTFYCNPNMIMSYSANLGMSYSKDAIMLPLEGGHYGRRGHYRDDSGRIEKAAYNTQSVG
ncbi:MAG: hypothetical protein WA066_01770 [Candidatus Omnitrophota bacterium]